MAGAEFVHQFEDASATASHAGQRILCDDDRDTSLFGDQFVDVTQQGAATRDDTRTMSR